MSILMIFICLLFLYFLNNKRGGGLSYNPLKPIMSLLYIGAVA